ncbi:MAG: glucodextranase DOMON-like domain-containing protein [Thermoanaerobaculia bacterium]
MLKRFLLATLLIAATAAAKDTPLWTLTDPRGDDYGNGKLAYPMNEDFQKGDLDLLDLSAYRKDGGTLFVASFARPIKQPSRRTIDAIGTQLDQVARLGFYTFNIDIYVDTDGVAGSGSTSTLPGRKVRIDPSTAWEKVICLTPDPAAARAELKRITVRTERRRAKSEGRKGIVSDELRDKLQSNVDQFIFFPTRVRVAGNRIEFFVPGSFLGGTASKDWSYVVAVSGADVIQRTDQQNRIMRVGDTAEWLMVLPVAAGRPADRFGGAAENDDFMPPLVDIIVPKGEDQKKVLSNYDADTDTAAVVKGVKPE